MIGGMGATSEEDTSYALHGFIVHHNLIKFDQVFAVRRPKVNSIPMGWL